MRRIELFLSVVALTAACGTNPPTSSSTFDVQPVDSSDDTASDATPADTSPADVSPSDVTPADITQPDVSPADVPAADASDDAPVDATLTDVPAVDVTVTDVPAVDVTVTDVPAVDVTVTDVPAVDVTVTDAPAADVRTDTPAADVRADAPADVALDVRTDVPVADVSADVALDARADVVTDAPSTDAAADVATDAPPTVPGPLQELWILRVGDGMAALTNAATPLFIERRASTDGATRATTLALPVAMSGTNRPITLSGTATSEGSLSRSGNGRFVTLAGYSATPGTAAVSSTTAMATPRVVGRVDAAGAFNTSTTLGSVYSANNVRGATTVDGTAFWSAGTGAPGGIQYQLLGASGEPVSVVSMPANIRTVGIFGGRLYGASSTSTPAPGIYSVFSVGASGTPTTADAPIAVLNGLPTASGPSPFSFVLLDRDPAIAGVDTLYIADDRAIASGGGVQRWSLTGTTWTLGPTFNAGITSGTRGVTAWIDGADAVIAAVTAETTSRVVLFRDRPGMAPTAALAIATAPTNTQFRGIALAPTP
jgi:hypothetical protein